MDPDQVDAGDDLVAATAYAGGSGDAGGGEESWARALLRRGWDLSRKVAIVGVAATAAPVVAPPIIIMSIAGVALSVPFAACLAAVAAADRLTGALLPPKPHYYTYYDLGLGGEEAEQESVDAPGEEEASVFGHWSKKTEADDVTEQSESLASLPLSQEPRLLLHESAANEEGDGAEGECAAIQKSGHEDAATKVVDNDGYITMEAPSPGDVSVLGVHVLRKEDTIALQRMDKDAPVPAKESSVSGSDSKTEDGKSTSTEEDQCREKGLDTSDLAVPIMLHDNDTMVGRDVQSEASVRKTGEHFDLSDYSIGDKTDKQKIREDMPPRVSESSIPDDNKVIEVVHAQLDVIVPENESLQSSERGAQELQAMTGSQNVFDTRGSSLTEGLVKDTDNKSAKGVERHGERGMTSMVRDDQNMRKDEVTVEMVLEEVRSSIDPVTGEVVEVQVDIIARESESLPLMSDLVAHDLHVVTRAETVDDKTEDIATSVEGRPDLEHHKKIGMEYKVIGRELETKLLPEDKDIYTEEQLREQLDTLRMITGYRAVPSLTLEGELAGLYMFVGVEPPHSSGDGSNLTELNKTLRFLKSIIGVE